jgi:hypothetical protein
LFGRSLDSQFRIPELCLNVLFLFLCGFFYQPPALTTDVDLRHDPPIDISTNTYQPADLDIAQTAGRTWPGLSSPGSAV